MNIKWAYRPPTRYTFAGISCDAFSCDSLAINNIMLCSIKRYSYMLSTVMHISPFGANRNTIYCGLWFRNLLYHGHMCG